jgi:hypothetical protein
MSVYLVNTRGCTQEGAGMFWMHGERYFHWTKAGAREQRQKSLAKGKSKTLESEELYHKTPLLLFF